jgi:hypothetical protein
MISVCSPDGPFALDVHQDLTAAIVVGQLGLQERCQVLDHVDLRLLDVLHPPEDLLAGLLVFGLLGAQLLFHAEVFLLRLLHLREGGVVSQAACLELLPCGLGRN